MHISIPKHELQSCVQSVLKAVSTKSTVPILQGILLQAKAGQLIFKAYDLEIGITCTSDANIVAEGTTVLPARIFSELVKRLPDEIIELKSDEVSMTIFYGDSEQTINTFSSDEYPNLPEFDAQSHEVQGLRVLASKVSIACARDGSRPVFQGIMFDGQNAVATDTHRLAMLKYPTNLEQVIIPGHVIQEVAKISDKAEISFKDNQVLFRAGNITLVSRTISGNFPNYGQVIPQSFTTEFTANREQLLGALERVGLLAEEKIGSSNVKLAIGDKLTITSVSGKGKARETLKIEKTGDDLEIHFNFHYLVDVLKVVEKPLFKLTGQMSPTVVMDGEYLYLVLPVRSGI